MNDRELMREALEFIERTSTHLPISFDTEGMALHAALRERLSQPVCKYPDCPYPCPDLPDCMDAKKVAQPEQEPYGIAYEYDGPFGLHRSFRHKYRNGKYPDRSVTLYTAPQPAKPLTDEQIDDLMPTNTSMSRNQSLRWMARAVERAHNIKEQNT